MLKNLIENLEKFEYRLMKIKNYSLMCSELQKERCKSLSNMVNVLSSLVDKTINGKNYHEDIALLGRPTEYNNISKKSQYLTMINCEEFLSEAEKLQSSTPTPDTLNNYLLAFHELLGDILFSICQMNNCEMKLKSGILVKDLVKIKNSYLSIWDLLSSMFFSNVFDKYNQTMRKQSCTNKAELQCNTTDLLNTQQLCLKDMLKVKMDIEHLIKFNMIEMKFNKKESKSEFNNHIENEEKNEKTFETDGSNNSFAGKCNENFNTNTFISKFPPKRPFRTPSSMFNAISKQSDLENQYIGSYLFPQNIKNWDGYDCKVIEDNCGAFISPQIIYPPEILFFDPTTLLIQSTVEPSQKHPLPKIYSLESVTEKNLDQSNCTNVEQISNEETKKCTLNFNNIQYKKDSLEIPQEDLFSESFCKKESDSEFINLKEKISSLFSMLKTNKVDCNEDIFNEVFKNPEKKELSYSKQQPFKSSDTKVKKKKNLQEKLGNKNTTSTLKNKNKWKKKSEMHNNQIKQLHKQDRSNIGNRYTRKQRKFDLQHPLQLLSFDKSDGVYGEKSIVQLFKTDKKDYLNSNSSPIEETTSTMWPVSAAYIYVSKEKTPIKCHSVSSYDSFSLPRGFEKSLFSIQMNKKYEQNHFYDGNLIVLDHIGDLPNERSSSCSLFNQSCATYDEERYQCAAPKISGMNHLYHDNYYEKPKNDTVTYDNKIIDITKKEPQTQQQTYAIQYSNCEDSFIMNSNFKSNKLDFLNLNTFSGSPNWDSFISIVTSKVGPTTKINERRMFRKIMNNIAPTPFHESNIFTNVQTLTSNGGPFRLFDVNGYPLTDSAGNVLKDPYSKSVVVLDSTGFPRDDMQVFDAAGNSPKDVNFDPTQKPKTNSIIVKLTDNFKRPLHLFDKYDRPLTDSNGKLLVNIHGRPLLRFDNFGRPNTDYRGGPLYTDNGLRWSYKTEQQSKEELSKEMLTERKINDPSVNASSDNLYSSSLQTEGQLKIEENICVNNSSMNYNEYLDNRATDIWLQVEKVLQQLPKKNIVDTKPCKDQTHLIGNSFTLPVKHIPFEKGNLNAIISLENNVKDSPEENKGTNNAKGSISSEILQPKEVNDIHSFLEKYKNHISKEFSRDYLNEKVTFPLYDNILIKNSYSKCFGHNKVSEKQTKNLLPNNTSKNKDIAGDNIFLNRSQIKGNYFKNSKDKQNNFVPNTATFKNQEYLNNLCNKILKNTLDFKKSTTLQDNPLANAATHFLKENFTDSSLSEFTSSLISKYTNDVLEHTESPTVSDALPRRDSQIIKLLGEIDSKFKKHNINIPNNCCDRDKTSRNDTMNKFCSFKNKEKYIKENRKKENKTYSDTHPNSTSTETTAYKEVSNVGNTNHYKNVKERIRAGVGKETTTSCGYENFISTDNSYKTNDSDFTSLEQEFVKNSLHPTENLLRYKHGNESYALKKEKNNKDSPFRFPSDRQMESTIAMNNDITYVNEKNWQVTKNSPVKYISDPLMKNSSKYNELYTNEMNNQTFFEKGDEKEFEINHKQAGNKHKYFERKPVKKPTTHNRDCNLVSFFGTPVKYVLNKLDNKLSLRHQHKSKSKRHNHSTDPDRKEIKTIYNESRYYKKDLTSSENERTDSSGKRRGRHYCEQRGQVLAFQSKSFSELQNYKKVANMSYSGNESSDRYFEYLPECSSQYHRCSSDTVVLSNHIKSDHSLQKSQRYKSKLKNKGYSFETNYVKKGHATHHYHHTSDKKSPTTNSKKQSGTNPKSSKNRSKNLKLFNKVEVHSKQRKEKDQHENFPS